LNQKILKFSYILAVIFLFACQPKSSVLGDRKIDFKNTNRYNEILKTFTISPKDASLIYSKWVMKKYNKMNIENVKGAMNY
jgi:hypothetical protein